MQVILLERVEKLGQIGQIVTVKPGYARNFLLSKKKALRANKDNIAYFEKQKAQIEANNLKQRQEAEYVANNMQDLTVTIIRQASEVGHLYGSIRDKDISESVSQAGFSVNKNQVNIIQAVKTLGLHTVQIKLHPEVSVNVQVMVAQSLEEAAAQLKAKNNSKIAEEATAPQSEESEESLV